MKLIEQNNSPTPADLLAVAVKKGADLQYLKELMDLQERWERKEAHKSFLDALSRFQSMVPVIKKKKTARINSQKGNYSYKYADLGEIGEQIKGALNECGLSYRWEFEEKDNKLKVTCFISHRDGHTETSIMDAARDASGGKNDIQQIGSTQTYLQRYTLIGGLGLTTADDDNDAHGHPTTGKVEQSMEEILHQWKQSVNGCKKQVELTSLYLKNRNTVDGSPEIQAIFKAREAELKSVKTEKVDMP
jgi:hypothetical protein